MTRRPMAMFLAGIALAACKPLGSHLPEAPARADLSAELIRLSVPGPPRGPEGACWASDVTPMMIESVSEQVLERPERRGPDGALIQAAVYRTETHQRIVQEREEIWFRAPCAAEWTVDFVASLQRALKARGYYLLPVTGVMDRATADAVQRFQWERGLDSPRLSLAAARELGLVPAEIARR